MQIFHLAEGICALGSWVFGASCLGLAHTFLSQAANFTWFLLFGETVREASPVRVINNKRAGTQASKI